jgi:acetate kinase
MRTLVLNCGSSSLKADVLDSVTGERLASARVERLGEPEALFCLGDSAPDRLHRHDHEDALRLLLNLPSFVEGVQVVGHRIVHGGERFSAPTLVDDAVIEAVTALVPLAPLHLPGNLAGLRAARAVLPDLPHVAVFDTAFHATLPPRARTYALPPEFTDQAGIRRYGFHGPSHAWVAQRAAEHLGADLRDLRLITCHLGNGASVCAIEYGRSIETSMGLTPMEGLVMGTRAGDLDPGVLLHLMRAHGMDVDALDDLLNRRSGLAGLSGTSGDMRDIEERASQGDEPARRALQVFAHRLRKYLGAYAAVLGGVDAIIFTGGIGENSALMRHRAAQRLDFLGARLDEDRNREARVSRATPVCAIHADNSRVQLLVVATDEAHAIARRAASIAAGLDRVEAPRTIPIAVSARHVHLTQPAVEALFGPGRTLTPRNPLSQPGQFACHETVDLIGPKRTIEGVRVLGPVRPDCQVEISRTDEFFLGIDAPVRASGDVRSSPGITLRGPAGTLTLKEGVICAWRHIHMAPEDAVAFGVKDKDVVEVDVSSGPRKLTFGDVMVRVHKSFCLEMHLDTDEANAAELNSGQEGMLVRSEGTAVLRRRGTRFDEEVA